MKSFLVGDRIILRKLKPSDCKDIYQNVKDREIAMWTLNIPHPYPKNGAPKFIRNENYKIKERTGYTLGIVFKKENKVVGLISLLNINHKNKNAELGYWIGKKYWGLGLMNEAVKLILNFTFKKIKLHRIYANLFEENIASMKVLRKAGFKLEGRERESRFRHGKWHNVLNYGILRFELLRKNKKPGILR